MQNYDVVVVGAGTGGTVAARFCVKKGLKVCLIDRKPRKEIGNKICGDAVGEEIFDLLNISHPKGEELSCNIKGAKLYSPNQKKCITLIDPKQTGYVVDRIAFGQRLLNEALDEGVESFMEETMVLDYIYKDKIISGVKVKSRGESQELHSKLVIDASGLYSPLRKKSKHPLIENDFDKDDAILCYREIVNFPARDVEVMDPKYISIYLHPERAPGGYIWYFPKGEHSINLGLGAYMNYKGKVKDFYHEYVFKEFVKSTNIEIKSSGGGVAPVRRPLWTCAEDGAMYVGDSGFQVNPLHGGGIDPSMRAGYYAAETALDAIEKGDYSLDTLWNYNEKIMKRFGGEFAALDLLRRVLQILSKEELNFGLEKELLSGEEILEIASKGSLTLSFGRIVSKAFKGISHPDLLLDLNYLRLRMEEIKKHYNNFPSNVRDFEEWKNKCNLIYHKIQRLIIDPKKTK